MTGDGCLMLVVSLIPLLYILLGCVNVSEVPKRPAYMADDGIRGFYGQRVPCGKGVASSHPESHHFHGATP